MNFKLQKGTRRDDLAVILVPASLFDAFTSRSYTDAVAAVGTETSHRHRGHEANSLVLRIGYTSLARQSPYR